MLLCAVICVFYWCKAGRNKKVKVLNLDFFSAQNWIRTSTSFRTLPPEGSASTNFAIWAFAFGRAANLLDYN